jgi:signal transduction histidine kinase
MSLSLFKTLSRYPFIHDLEFYDSNELKQNKTCITKCKKKGCLSLMDSKESSHFICEYGFDNRLVLFEENRYIINGIIYPNNSKILEGTKKVRANWVVNPNDIDIFLKKLEGIENEIKNRVNHTIESNFSMFHDFKTSMNIFFSCTQELINRLPGSDFESKLKSSDSLYQSLFSALQLITSQLGMIDVIINPKRIQFGNKKSVNLYRLFEKIKILFSHVAANKRDIKINLISEGRRIRDCYCYESIEFIPLILIDNALKYCVPGYDVDIKLEQSFNSVKVIVKNIGPLVPEENKDLIFHKFYRDPSAEEFAKEGIGMGLWIAQSILNAHNSKLNYFGSKFTTFSKINPKMGLNIFEFDLPTQ